MSASIKQTIFKHSYPYRRQRLRSFGADDNKPTTPCSQLDGISRLLWLPDRLGTEVVKTGEAPHHAQANAWRIG